MGGRVATQRWVVLGTDNFVEWLMSCHNDMNVVMRVYAHLMDTIDKLEAAGPSIDRKWAKPLKGFDGLSEARYNDATSRAYRSFFKFGRLDGRRVVVFADGDSKTTGDFLQTRYERAGRILDEAMAEAGIRAARDW
jgi:hypothetical protein